MAQKIDEFPNEADVLIKPEAYIKMLKHVLMYGNKNKENSVEVMGICYGKKEGDKLVQYDSIPISHGSSIEVQFDPQDYAAFAAADEEMGKKDYFAIGWYHSHPGLKAFFSKVDIRNHLGWQTDHNPDAYGIVFDHTYFDLGEGDKELGFQAFRLDDYKKGMESDYHEITDKITVEFPDDTSFYDEISNIIEDIQSKEPIIKEAKEELITEGAEWEEEEEQEEEEEEDEFEEIKGSMTQGMKNFSTIFLNPMLEQLEDFTKETGTAIKKGPATMTETLGDMRDAIGAGLSRIQTFFEEALEKEIEDASESIEKEIRKFGMKQMQVPKKLQGFTKLLSEELGEVIDEQMNVSLRDFLGKLRKVSGVANNLSQKQSEFEETINSQSQTLSSFPSLVEKETTALSQSIGGLPNQLNEMVSKKSSNLSQGVEDLEQVNSELKDMVEQLKDVIMKKRG